MYRSPSGEVIQGFIADPDKSQVSASMSSIVVFQKGSGGDVDITGWEFIQVCPIVGSSYYYNNDTTKLWPLPIGVISQINVLNPNVNKVVVQFGVEPTSSCVQGM